MPGQSLPPATMPDKTAISLRNNLFPGQGVTLDGNRSPAEGAIALQRDAWTKSQLVLAKNASIESEAKATEAVAKAKSEMAKARKDNAEALEAEAKAKVAVAEADPKAEVAKAKSEEAKARKAEAEARTAEAEARVAEAQETTKISSLKRVAGAEALEADLKILKLRKEIDVFTGECEVQEYLLLLSLRPSLCLSLTACFSD